MHPKPQVHEYDKTLKSLFGAEAPEILPRLLPDTEYLDEQNIEIDRTTLKADLVYQVRYKGQRHIINMELQTGRDGTIEMRLLMYHAGLLLKHKLPVLSVILYPFETTVPQPPFREQNGDGETLVFHYTVLALWTYDARQFVQEQAFCLYTLLPTMRYATVELLKQALQAMKQHYTQRQSGHHLIRFHRILLRSTTGTYSENQRDWRR